MPFHLNLRSARLAFGGLICALAAGAIALLVAGNAHSAAGSHGLGPKNYHVLDRVQTAGDRADLSARFADANAGAHLGLRPTEARRVSLDKRTAAVGPDVIVWVVPAAAAPCIYRRTAEGL